MASCFDPGRNDTYHTLALFFELLLHFKLLFILCLAHPSFLSRFFHSLLCFIPCLTFSYYVFYFLLFLQLETLNLKEFKYLKSILFQSIQNDFQNNNESAGSICNFYDNRQNLSQNRNRTQNQNQNEKKTQNLNDVTNETQYRIEKNSTLKNFKEKRVNEEEQYQQNNNFDHNINHTKKHTKVFLFIVDALRLDFMIQTKKLKNNKHNNKIFDSVDKNHKNIDKRCFIILILC